MTAILTPAAYIPSRGRADALRRTAPSWYAAAYIPHYVVPDHQFDTYAEVAQELWVKKQVPTKLLTQPATGIGDARNYAVRHAADIGHTAIAMADDDIRPATLAPRPAIELVKQAGRRGVLAISARVPYMDFAFKAALERNAGSGPVKLDDLADIVLLPTGLGFRMTGLNVQTCIKLGNYDPELDCANEDAEMMRVGISKGIPWLLHTGVLAVSLGARHAPGGVQEFLENEGGRWEHKKQERLDKCHKLVHERWPDAVSAPGTPLRTRWQMLYNQYIPQWREYSGIHNGVHNVLNMTDRWGQQIDR